MANTVVDYNKIKSAKNNIATIYSKRIKKEIFDDRISVLKKKYKTSASQKNRSAIIQFSNDIQRMNDSILNITKLLNTIIIEYDKAEERKQEERRQEEQRKSQEEKRKQEVQKNQQKATTTDIKTNAQKTTKATSKVKTNNSSNGNASKTAKKFKTGIGTAASESKSKIGTAVKKTTSEYSVNKIKTEQENTPDNAPKAPTQETKPTPATNEPNNLNQPSNEQTINKQPELQPTIPPKQSSGYTHQTIKAPNVTNGTTQPQSTETVPTNDQTGLIVEEPTIVTSKPATETIMIDDESTSNIASDILEESTKSNSNAIPIGLGVAAAGAAAIAGARYIKNKDRDEYTDEYDDNYDEYKDDNYNDNNNDNDNTYDESKDDTSEIDYSYKAESTNEITSHNENIDEYNAGEINKLSLEDGDDVMIDDDYYEDDFNEELE